MIGLCTAFIGDIAGHLGCFIFLKDSVNAIAFVALGTSVPGRIGRDLRNAGVSGRSFSVFSLWLCIYPCPIENAKNQRYSRPNLWFDNGMKKEIGSFINGSQSGTWTYYNKDGTIDGTEEY